MRVMAIPTSIGALVTVPKGLESGVDEPRLSSIVKIGQNTVKNQGDPWRLVVIQTPVKGLVSFV